MGQQQIGVVGVGVMGKSLALNFESRGYKVAIYDVSEEKWRVPFRSTRTKI